MAGILISTQACLASAENLSIPVEPGVWRYERSTMGIHIPGVGTQIHKFLNAQRGHNLGDCFSPGTDLDLGKAVERLNGGAACEISEVHRRTNDIAFKAKCGEQYGFYHVTWEEKPYKHFLLQMRIVNQTLSNGDFESVTAISGTWQNANMCPAIK